MAASHWWHLHTVVSLVVIIALLGAAVVLSVRKNQRDLAACLTRLAPEPRSRRTYDSGVTRTSRRSDRSTSTTAVPSAPAVTPSSPPSTR